MHPEGYDHIIWTFEAREKLSLAALVILGLNWVGSLHSEYYHVWGKKFTATKFMFLWSRYVALATLIAHYCFIHLFLARGPVAPSFCRGWILFLSLSCTSLQMSLVVILLLRVWAVYSKNMKLVMVVAALVVLPFIVSFELIGRNILHDDNLNDQCDLRQTPIEAAPLAAVSFLSHLALWFTIFRKRNYVMPNDKRLMDTVVNTGNVSFTVLTLIVAVMIPYCFATHSVNIVLIFVVPMVPISMLSCKMVINMFRLRTDRPPDFWIQAKSYLLRSLHPL
ncbi:hypothetical protein CPB84DRAFT_1794334 [Gymnopilus junonius]|uniref:DUF6533 domain-containing protein n=1 Tax=Gymnopilus junonius TaxID=109634 RepID=A0A9P5TGJ1_GYMJU|nr:hypothetical protein CPB84DRAFT_1794334 [Gymnopilus junonius]